MLSGGDDLLADVGLDAASEEAASSATDIAGTTTAPAKPGVYGNLYELQIDVSRLPRVDQYGINSAAGDAMGPSIPSDIKTIAYYLQTEQSLASGITPYTTAIGGNNDETGGGLVRRELDRAFTLYASNNGGSTQDFTMGELLAPEVVGLEFRYFDVGTPLDTPLEEWDSELNGGLPVGVEITLMIRRQPEDDGLISELSGLFSSSDPTNENVGVYRLFVALPMGGSSSAGGEAATDATSSEDDLLMSTLGGL